MAGEQRLLCRRRDSRRLIYFIGADLATAWLEGVVVAGDGFVLTDAQLSAGQLGDPWVALNRAPLPFETRVPEVSPRATCGTDR